MKMTTKKSLMRELEALRTKLQAAEYARDAALWREYKAKKKIEKDRARTCETRK